MKSEKTITGSQNKQKSASGAANEDLKNFNDAMIIGSLESQDGYNFRCEAGPLYLCQEWTELKRRFRAYREQATGNVEAQKKSLNSLYAGIRETPFGLSAELDKELSDMEVLWGILGHLDMAARSRMLGWVEQRIEDMANGEGR